MEPWLSWGIALVVGGLAFYYYNAQKKLPVNKTRASSISDAIPPQAKPARKREDGRVKSKTQTGATGSIQVPSLNVEAGDGHVSTSGAEPTKKRKAAKKQQPAPYVPTAAVVESSAPEEDDQDKDDDTKAWAQGLVALKKGTTLAPPARTDSRNRTVKQSAASLTPNFSSTSSDAADADDDLTPARSPALVAGGVSDMLEPTSSGPSILRLTESSNPVKAKQQRLEAQLQVAETKKQRQNRKKVEERRLEREADEKERQVLLEKQRRAARESRGEPARNGIPASKPPAVSEWAVKAAARAIQAPAEEANVNNTGLLDTFDEDDQMRMAKKLSEDESGWNMVPKGKKQKKTTQASGPVPSNGSDTGSAPSVSYEQTTATAPTPVFAPVPTPAPVSKVTEPHSNGYSSLSTFEYDAGSHPEDSQWSA